MNIRIPLLCLFTGLLLPYASGEETLEDYRPLLDNSPFMTQAFKDRLAKLENTSLKDLTFNGYTQLNDAWQLCFILKSKKQAIWKEVGSTIEGFTIKAFDPENHAVTLEKAGVMNILKMDKPK